MPLRLIVGPPGAGKTHRVLELTHAAARAGRRVAWVALPHQHHDVVRALAAKGPTLGVEVLSSQRLMYRLLAGARALRPLVTGTERLALVGASLREILGRVPSPGEARLFAAAVAEARRHDLHADDVGRIAETLRRGAATDAAEVQRLADVLAGYERSLAGRMDYDDVRTLALAHARRGQVALTAELVVVDGFRELGPLDLAFYEALARDVDVVVTLPHRPPGMPADETLPERPSRRRAHVFANTVAEARWVLRALKADLAGGARADELAVIAPPGVERALAALADEFGVPLVDEAPASLADTAAGHVLCELLELVDHATAARLLVVPELVPVARAALERGVAGREALEALASTLGLEETYRHVTERLRPGGDLGAWAVRLVDLALELSAHLPGDAEEVLGGTAIRDLLLLRAQEAMRLGAAEAMPPWWAALVRETHVRRRQRAGVRVLGATTASGRRFRTAYVMGAWAGAYAADEAEDYFVPEDARRDPLEVMRAVLDGHAAPGLPRRHRGGDRLVLAELVTRGDDVVVTVAEADRGGPLRPEPELVGATHSATDRSPPPPLPAGSPLEAADGAAYRAPGGAVEDASVTIEELRRSHPCTFRVWAERLVRAGAEEALPPPLLSLRRALTERHSLDRVRRAELEHAHPEAAAWLRAQAPALERHAFGVRLPSRPAAPTVRLDAVERRERTVRLVRFLAEGDEAQASLDPRRRLTELYAARLLLRRADVDEVRLVAWPLLGEPVDLDGGVFGRGRGERRLERVALEVDERWRRWRAGPAVPTPGRQCGRCPVRDLCREAPA